MSTLQTKTSNSPKQRSFQSRISCLALFIGFGVLIYCGYCLGLWGRNSLLLQYLFQCSCPGFSEEWRRPKQVDVIVSACRESWVDLSPSGRFLAVYEKHFDPASTHLLDLQTMERTTVVIQPYSRFLTDGLGFIQYPESYLVDRTTGTQYPIRKFAYRQPGAYIIGEANLSLLPNALLEAQYVFFDNDDGTLIALAQDFQNRPERNFFLPRLDFPGSELNRVEQFLRDNHIQYNSITSFPDEAISPNGRFIARREGIFLIETNRKIVEGVDLWLRGWTNDGSGVIYSPRYSGPCLIPLIIPLADDTGCLIEVDEPVLLLKVPEEYLLSTETP